MGIRKYFLTSASATVSATANSTSTSASVSASYTSTNTTAANVSDITLNESSTVGDFSPENIDELNYYSEISTSILKTTEENQSNLLCLGKLETGPNQIIINKFPLTAFGDQKRSFNTEWYKEFPFIEYSLTKDAVLLTVSHVFK